MRIRTHLPCIISCIDQKKGGLDTCNYVLREQALKWSKVNNFD